MGGGFQSENVGEGDCDWATGVATIAEGGDADGTFIVQKVGVE